MACERLSEFTGVLILAALLSAVNADERLKPRKTKLIVGALVSKRSDSQTGLFRFVLWRGPQP